MPPCVALIRGAAHVCKRSFEDVLHYWPFLGWWLGKAGGSQSPHAGIARYTHALARSGKLSGNSFSNFSVSCPVRP